MALDLLKNANVSAGGILPMCQDTGTAIVKGKKSEGVLTGGDDEEAIARGIFETYQTDNLRYSQMAPLSMWEETNTKTNLPAEIKISATPGGGEPKYEFLFMAKGGGSANKSYLYQETKALLTPDKLLAFLDEKLRSLGTAACPPYHLAVVIGGTSAEMALETAKLASTRYLDSLPKQGSPAGHAFRDVEFEAEVLKLSQEFGIGAQFGGKYFCHDVRVIRMPRHGASLPGGGRRVVLGRSPGQGQDHRRGRVPRTARDEPGPLPSRRHRGRRVERRRPHRPQPTDGRHPRPALDACR